MEIRAKRGFGGPSRSASFLLADNYAQLLGARVSFPSRPRQALVYEHIRKEIHGSEFCGTGSVQLAQHYAAICWLDGPCISTRWPTFKSLTRRLAGSRPAPAHTSLKS